MKLQLEQTGDTQYVQKIKKYIKEPLSRWHEREVKDTQKRKSLIGSVRYAVSYVLEKPVAKMFHPIYHKNIFEKWSKIEVMSHSRAIYVEPTIVPIPEWPATFDTNTLISNKPD